MLLHPGTHPKKALREAKDIAKLRETYRVIAEDKSTTNKKTPWKSLPEHVKATIKKKKDAEAEREKAGRKLATPKVVSGGSVSPK